MVKTSLLAHIIDIKSGVRIAQPLLQHAPRVGDELRLDGYRYYKVVKVVWPLDENESLYTRINIGVKKIQENKDA